MVKNLAVNHLPLEAPPAVQTWTANCKRDRKAVVTWHFAVCGLPFPTKNPIIKVHNILLGFSNIPGFNLWKLSRLSGVFLPFVGHFFKRAREPEGKLRHVVYEVWLVSYLFFLFQIWYFLKWIITNIGQSKHMRVTRFNSLWVSVTSKGISFVTADTLVNHFWRNFKLIWLPAEEGRDFGLLKLTFKAFHSKQWPSY